MMNYKFKNSARNDFAINMLLAFISVMLIVIGFKIVSNKVAIVVYALSIAVSYCRVAVEAIEKIAGRKIHSSLISTVAVLVIFTSQNFMAAAIVAVIYSVSKAISDFICSVFSEKLLENEDIKPCYNVVSGEELKRVSVDELVEGDVVKVNKGDYLAFSYSYVDSSGVNHNFKSGKFSVCDEALVSFVSPYPYEIDFEASTSEEPSNSERITALISKAYTVIALVIAVLMFVLKIVKGAVFTDSLFTLGVFLLFANPLSINSGVLQAGFFLRKDLKRQGINLKNVCEVEKLSRVKKVLFAQDVVMEDEKFINEDVIKTVKIADVLKIETELLGSGDEKETEAIAVAAGFNQFESGCDEDKTKEIIAEQVIQGTVAYVSSGEIENTKIENTKNVLSLSRANTSKKALTKLVQEIKSAKIYKWFVNIRMAFGALVNFAVIAVYASGIGDKFLHGLLEDSGAQGSVASFTLKEKIAKWFIYNNSLAPWFIGIVHLCLINILLLVTIAFLNNNKKLR